MNVVPTATNYDGIRYYLSGKTKLIADFVRKPNEYDLGWFESAEFVADQMREAGYDDAADEIMEITALYESLSA